MDRNGNAITITPTAPSNGEATLTIKDALGRQLTVVSHLDAMTQPVTDTITASGFGSTPLTWTVNWASYQSTDNAYGYCPPGFNGTTCPSFTPNATVVQSILPPKASAQDAQLQYQFSYYFNPGWGHLKTATNPYGVATTYQYTNECNAGYNATTCGSTASLNSMPVTTKTETWTDPQGVPRSEAWSYTSGANPGSYYAVIDVTAPDGGTTLHNFCQTVAGGLTATVKECSTVLPNGDTTQRTWIFGFRSERECRPNRRQRVRVQRHGGGRAQFAGICF